jgi:hypothetical protein
LCKVGLLTGKAKNKYRLATLKRIGGCWGKRNCKILNCLDAEDGGGGRFSL